MGEGITPRGLFSTAHSFRSHFSVSIPGGLVAGNLGEHVLVMPVGD